MNTVMSIDVVPDDDPQMYYRCMALSDGTWRCGLCANGEVTPRRVGTRCTNRKCRARVARIVDAPIRERRLVRE